MKIGDLVRCNARGLRETPVVDWNQIIDYDVDMNDRVGVIVDWKPCIGVDIGMVTVYWGRVDSKRSIFTLHSEKSLEEINAKI